MPQVSETAHISGGDVATKAKRLWVAIREETVRRKTPQIMTKYGAGYYLFGTVQSYAVRLWGDNNPELKTIRGFLKASGNVVVVSRIAGTRESKIFVRNHWNEAVAVPVGGGGSRVDRIEEVARKLTPEEAGETRPPAEVVITRVSPYVGPVPGTIVLNNGNLRCGACGYETSTTSSMGSHKRKHYHERERELAARAAPMEPMLPLPTEAPKEVAVPTVVDISGDVERAASIKHALQEAIDLLDSAASNERAAEAFMVENIQLTEKVQSLIDDNQRLVDENARLVDEVRTALREPKADAATTQRLSDTEAVIELVRGVVARYNRAEAGPVRTLLDIEDLLPSS